MLQSNLLNNSQAKYRKPRIETMSFMAYEIPFVITSNVTYKELDESFINTRNVETVKIADFISRETFYETEVTNEVWDKVLDLITTHFPEIGSNDKKYLSYLIKPLNRDFLDSFQIWDEIFNGEIEGFQKYTAILSHIVDSAPGQDSLWPYGRYSLNEVEHGLYNKVIGNMAGGSSFDDEIVDRLINMDQEKSLPEYSEEQDHLLEIPWRKIYKFYHLNDTIKTFGLLICNFKDTLDEFGPWYKLFNLIIGLDESHNPAVNKVAVRQTAFQIVSKYIELRKNSSDHEKLANDIRIFKLRFFNFEEIQKIRLTDLALDLTPQYEWKKVCQVLGNLGIPELNLPSSITTTIVEDRSYTPHFDEQGCFNSIAGYSLEMGVRNRDAGLNESVFRGIDLAAYLEGQPDEDFFCYSEHGNGYSSFAGFVVRTQGMLISHQVGLGSNISVHPFNAQTFDAFNKYLTPHLHEDPESIFDHVIVLYSEYREDFWILSTDPSSWDPNKPNDYDRLRIPERYGIVGRWQTLNEDETYAPQPLGQFNSPIYTPRLRAAAQYLESCLSVDHFFND